MRELVSVPSDCLAAKPVRHELGRARPALPLVGVTDLPRSVQPRAASSR